jgi:hypothetical protein
MRFVSAVASPRLLCRLLAFALLVLLSATTPSFAATLYVDDLSDGKSGKGTSAEPYRDLQKAIDNALSGDLIFIRAGRYVATPTEFIDPTCGNCPPEQFWQDIYGTYGFRIAGKSLNLVGESRKNTVLVTNAGYGVLFEDAGESRLENVTITEGLRDWDSRATNAAVVVRWTNLTVRNTNILNNTNLWQGEGEEVVAGIGGLFGREGSVIDASNVLIYNNGWDGVALYRGDPAIPDSGARATITKSEINRGRGVGIGVTWDAQADIKNTRVTRYWKGVGSFGASRVSLRNSIVDWQEIWGVIADGTSHLTATNNVIAFQGRSGLSQWSPSATVNFTNNIVYDNGWNDANPIGPRTGIWITNLTKATITYNDTFTNTPGNVCLGPDCIPYDLTRFTGNIVGDPMFVDALNGNYTLKCGSHAINAGDHFFRDIDGTRSDMGVYGGPESLQAPSCFLPDLQPTWIVASPSGAEAGDVVRFESVVHNASLSVSGYFNVKWFIDGAEVIHLPHAGVPGNTYAENSVHDWTATQGTHTVTFSVDTGNNVSEGNEGNNSSTLTFVIPPRRADLTPTPITYNPADLVAGRRVFFDSGVQNLRNVGTAPFRIKWYVDNVQMGYGNHIGIAGNATVTGDNSFFWWNAVSGTHTIRFDLDVDGQVPEGNEYNNSLSITVTVP